MKTQLPAIRHVIMLGLLLAAGCSALPQHPEIASVLESQQSYWNQGDIDGFMQGYWKSDELTFHTPEGQTTGWQAVRDRYKNKYQKGGRMGRLTFDRLTISKTAEDTADASGVYRLDGPEGVRSGRFYLKMRRIDGNWVIVRDFTTPDAPTVAQTTP